MLKKSASFRFDGTWPDAAKADEEWEAELRAIREQWQLDQTQLRALEKRLEEQQSQLDSERQRAEEQAGRVRELEQDRQALTQEAQRSRQEVESLRQTSRGEASFSQLDLDADSSSPEPAPRQAGKSDGDQQARLASSQFLLCPAHLSQRTKPA